MGKYAPILRIAEYGSLTRAAQAMGYTQSGMSYIINSLEKELGTKIFRRERQGVTLTDAGRELLAVMTEMERLDAKLQHIALSHRVGVLRIGSFTSASTQWLPEILRRFYQKYPETAVHVLQTNQYIDLTLGLQNNAIDCGFFAGEHSAAFDFIPLHEDEYFVVTGAWHPLAEKKAVSVEELYQHSFILPSEGYGPGPIADLCQQLKGTCRIFTQSSEDSPTIHLVESGLGFSILPALLLEELARGRQIAAIPFEKPLARTLGILSKPQADANDVTKTFIQLSKEFIQEWKPTCTWGKTSSGDAL